MRFKLRFLLVVLLLVIVTGVPLSAQDDVVILKLGVPSFIRDLVQDSVIEQFEAENPGIQVQLVFTDNAPNFNPNGEVGEYVEDMASYAAEADVLAVTNGQMTAESIRAGIFLDVSPLIATDAAFDEADFFPAIWNSVQWDNGIWAVPVSADIVTIVYDPIAFDNAGVPYPDSWWTIDDFIQAVRDLTEYDENGNIVTPAFLDANGDLAPLLLSLLGDSVVDDSFVPAVPRFTNNAPLENLLNTWIQLEDEGLLNPQVEEFTLDVPMILGQSAIASAGGIFENERALAFMPGGRPGLLVNSAAISAGTQYPEEAYQLVKFISNSAELANAFFGVTPARQSLIGAEVDGPALFFGEVPEEQQPIIDAAVFDGFGMANQRFSAYLGVVLNNMAQTGVDAATALQEVETDILQRLDEVDALSEDIQIIIEPPEPRTDVRDGTVLNFGIQSFVPNLRNQDRWDQVVADFTASDPQISAVNIEPRQPFGANGLATMAEEYDCFYMPSNVVQTGDLTLVRNMDPLMSTDPAFNRNDFAGGVLEQMQRDNQTWAMPLTIQPQVLWYNEEAFNQSGAPLPFPGWSVSDFEISLRALRIDPDDPPVFESRDFDSSHLLVLIAAYGGLPIDYRTSPITVNFTDPATVEAIRQVLDLAKEGYLDYSELSGGAFNFNFNTNDEIPMYSQLLNDIAFLLGGGSAGDEDSPYRLTAFPQGSQYSAVSYDIGGAYISANTSNLEGCYRFISYISQVPDLFDGMPARRSAINSPELAAAQGQEAVAFYNEMDALMAQPNTVLIPSLFSAINDLSGAASNFIILNWLNRAFDRYVLEDADLEFELQEAELFALNYQECVAAIPPFDPLLEDQLSYLENYTDCAVQVDPASADLFGINQ